MTWDTVPFETPATRATSSMVGWVRLPGRPSFFLLFLAMGGSRGAGATKQAETRSVGRGHAVLAVVEGGEWRQFLPAQTCREPRSRRHRHQRRIGRKARL